MAMIGLIALFGMIVSMDSFRGQNFRNEVNLAASVLQKARAQAQSNINQAPHGVCYDSGGAQYVIFEGAGCAGGSNVPMQNNNVNISGWPAGGVVFEQLTGNCQSGCPATITLTQNSQSANITVNSKGQIDY